MSHEMNTIIRTRKTNFEVRDHLRRLDPNHVFIVCDYSNVLPGLNQSVADLVSNSLMAHFEPIWIVEMIETLIAAKD